MTALSKTNVATIRRDVDAALAAVAAKHGLTFSLGTIRFNAETLRATLSAAVNNPTTGTAEPLEFKELKLRGTRILGVTEADIVKTMTSPSLGTVKFVGYHARKPKYPFIVETTAGKRFKLSTTSARSILAASGL